MKSIYIIGALKNLAVIDLANELQNLGFEAFADWITPGPDADNYLLEYGKKRGWSYEQILNSYAARHVFEFDKFHIDRCDAAVLLMPSGKSACLELGYVRGCGKPGYILFDEEPERVDVMFTFASGVFFDKQKLFNELKGIQTWIPPYIPSWSKT